MVFSSSADYDASGVIMHDLEVVRNGALNVWLKVIVKLDEDPSSEKTQHANNRRASRDLACSGA